MFIYPLRLHCRKTNFSFASSCQLEIASLLGMDACVHFPLSAPGPHLSRPCALCHGLCKFILRVLLMGRAQKHRRSEQLTEVIITHNGTVQVPGSNPSPVLLYARPIVSLIYPARFAWNLSFGLFVCAPSGVSGYLFISSQEKFCNRRGPEDGLLVLKRENNRAGELEISAAAGAGKREGKLCFKG